jgi:hypothetical protein
MSKGLAAFDLVGSLAIVARGATIRAGEAVKFHWPVSTADWQQLLQLM